MANGKPIEEIIKDIKKILEEAKIKGEKLNGTSIARRVGCGRTTLYTNLEIKSLLIEEGIIDDTPHEKKKIESKEEESKIGDILVYEKKLKHAEERANRSELLLSQANEQISLLEEEIQSLKLQVRLLSEGKSIL